MGDYVKELSNYFKNVNKVLMISRNFEKKKKKKKNYF